jgi:hypothetical protein
MSSTDAIASTSASSTGRRARVGGREGAVVGSLDRDQTRVALLPNRRASEKHPRR